jgi:hypothetical protein
MTCHRALYCKLEHCTYYFFRLAIPVFVCRRRWNRIQRISVKRDFLCNSDNMKRLDRIKMEANKFMYTTVLYTFRNNESGKHVMIESISSRSFSILVLLWLIPSNNEHYSNNLFVLLIIEFSSLKIVNSSFYELSIKNEHNSQIKL